MKRNDYIYEVYFYSEPHFFVLENDQIIDVNIGSFEKELNYKFTTTAHVDKEKWYLDLQHNDDFFHHNFISSKKEDFLIIIQNFSRSTGYFIQQIQIQADALVSRRENSNWYTRWIFEQMITNDLGNLPQKFKPAFIVYQKERASYFRDKKIDALIDNKKI